MEARFLAVCSGHFNFLHFVICFLYNSHVHVLIAGQFVSAVKKINIIIQNERI